MAKKIKGDQVFTGQLLREGDVVFLGTEDKWSTDLQDALVATTAEEVEVLEESALKGVSDNLVVDIYPFEVLRDKAGRLTPAHIREIMRTKGPSIAFGYDS